MILKCYSIFSYDSYSADGGNYASPQASYPRPLSYATNNTGCGLSKCSSPSNYLKSQNFVAPLSLSYYNAVAPVAIPSSLFASSKNSYSLSLPLLPPPPPPLPRSYLSQSSLFKTF